LQHHPGQEDQKIANEGMKKISQETGIPVVATGDIHYTKIEDAETQDILLCIQMNRKVQEKDRMNLMDFHLHMKSPKEMFEVFGDTPEALENTQVIVDKCNYEISLGEIQLPYFEVPEGFDDKSYLRHLTEKGLKDKFGDNITPEHRQRMEYELSIIEKMGYPSYFLIVQDFVNWARSQGIVVGPGRGSAAGSFVSYLVGITNIDPIKYDLLFERFLNPERISMPDVDMDFADDRRDEVLDYVRKKYGDDHVAQIITFGTMAARAAIRDAGRALDYPYDYCDKTAKMIPMFSTIEGALEDVPEFRNFYQSDKDAKKLIDSAKNLEGVARHASMHACGVVITKEPVTNYSPLQKITGKDKGDGVVTQYSSSTKSSYVEKIGLLKMDFLGLKNLTIIQNAINIIAKTKGVKIDIDKIPLD
ncbi:MAG: DNA polymerase III subunit alpha, partial [Sphingobacteriia bacterium]|nr:DNA polymerase III subunit alpha [Sphingobacteriia bacterium]